VKVSACEWVSGAALDGGWWAVVAWAHVAAPVDGCAAT